MQSLFEFFMTGSQRAFMYVPLCAALFLLQVSRSELLRGDVVVFVVCALAWIAFCWIRINNMGFFAHAVPVVIIGWITLQSISPSTTDSLHTAMTVAEHRIEETAQHLAVDTPERIPCNKDTVAHGQVYLVLDRISGEQKPALWYAVRSGRIECWDRSGIHPQTGEELEAVNKHIASLIARQEAPGSGNGAPSEERKPVQSYQPIIDSTPRPRTYQLIPIIDSN